MRPWIPLVLISFLYFSCQPETKDLDPLLQQLPPDPEFILKINHLSNFLSELKNNAFLEKTKKIAFCSAIVKNSRALNLLDIELESVLAFYQIGKNDYGFIFVAPYKDKFLRINDSVGKSIETLTYQNEVITKYEVDGSAFFSTRKKTFLAISSSMMLLENLIRAKEPFSVDNNLKKLYATASKDKSATLFMRLNADNSMINNLLRDEHTAISMADWASLDFTAHQGKVIFSGVAVAADSSKNFIHLFRGTKPLANKTPALAPLNAQALFSYTFDDYSVFAENQNSYLDRIKPIDSLFSTVEEIGTIYTNGQKVVVLSSFGAENLATFLTASQISSSTYQGSEIIELDSKRFIVDAFDPLVKKFESNFYAILENTFVFSETKEALQAVIANYKSRSSFYGSPVYKTALSAFANESSALFVSDASGIDLISEQELDPKLFEEIEKTDIKEYTFAVQLVADNGFSHANLLVSRTMQDSVNNTVSLLFTLELESDLATDPQFVKNHRTNRYEIVVQDMDNFLYLISTDGKVLWKKQLEGLIQGRIHQVDLYKNGRLQLAFCTNDAFLILDRNGDSVIPFKKKFEGENLNPLAVFDYESNRDYRFVVSQGKKVFMYNNKAKIVDGFSFKEAASNIVGAPKHFRVSNKDYLVFKLENKNLKILHRVGTDRIKLDQKIAFSENEIFLHKNKFSTTTNKGALVQVDTKGKLTSTDFGLNKNHGMSATDRTLVFMDDNVLSIKGKKVELESGVYTKPKIFYIYDKIYVSVTDIQNQKIYLFDSQAQPIPNFPVFGISLIDLVDMDNDKKLELVAKDQENSLTVYKMN